MMGLARTLLSSSSFLMWSAMKRILSIAFWTSGEYWYDAKSGCSTGSDRIKWGGSCSVVPFQFALLGVKQEEDGEKKRPEEVMGKSVTWPTVNPLGQSAPSPIVSVIESRNWGTSSSIKFPSPWHPGERRNVEGEKKTREGMKESRGKKKRDGEQEADHIKTRDPLFWRVTKVSKSLERTVSIPIDEVPFYSFPHLTLRSDSSSFFFLFFRWITWGFFMGKIHAKDNEEDERERWERERWEREKERMNESTVRRMNEVI